MHLVRCDSLAPIQCLCTSILAEKFVNSMVPYLQSWLQIWITADHWKKTRHEHDAYFSLPIRNTVSFSTYLHQKSRQKDFRQCLILGPRFVKRYDKGPKCLSKTCAAFTFSSAESFLGLSDSLSSVQVFQNVLIYIYINESMWNICIFKSLLRFLLGVFFLFPARLSWRPRGESIRKKTPRMDRCSLMLLWAFQICSLLQWQFIAMKLNLQSNRFSFRATALTYLAVCTTVTREHGGRSAKVREFLSALGILSLRGRHSHTKIDSIHKKALWPSDI